jgi:co-chaperonin GroES (HSP10)
MLKPIKANVILELIQKEKVTQSGLILSSADPSEANRGKVLAVGPDVTDVSIGDTVLPNWNAARPTKYENEDIYIIDQKEIVGVFQ